MMMDDRSKILMIGPDLNSFGGISAVIKLYKDNNLYDGNVIYLASYKKGNIFLQLIFYPIFIIKYIFTLLLNKNIKLIHIHTASNGSFLRKYVVFKIAKLFHKKIIFNIHPIWFVAFYNSSNNFIKKMIAGTLNNSDLILVLSDKIKSAVSDICQNNNIKILYNPVLIKQILPHNNQTINVIYLGKLCKDKGVYDIIEAAKYITNTDIMINLYGDGNIKELEKLITENNLQKKIKINGWISGNKKDKVLQNSDILILPSYNEGLPISILEAMAVGLPVISTPVGGIPEAIEDGLDGFLIQPGDYKALAKKIDLLANDKSLREQMGQKSYKMAKEKFDVNIMLEQLRNIYNDLLR